MWVAKMSGCAQLHHQAENSRRNALLNRFSGENAAFSGVTSGIFIRFTSFEKWHVKGNNAMLKYAALVIVAKLILIFNARTK
jgi:hypothetical protein